LIQFDNVSLEYSAGRFALREVSFRLPAGAFCFLTGHSGAGKSSLLKLIARLEKPTDGHISIGEKDLTELKTRQEPALRQQMGLVFQDNQLLYDRSVFDNVALPLIIGGYKFKEINQRVSAALDRVALAHKANDDPITLSGGEQQRVGIARAVVAKPKLLLADEPTGNLDAEISADIMRLLMQFSASGVTVLVATHDNALLETFDFPRLHLKQGRLVNIYQGASQANMNTASRVSKVARSVARSSEQPHEH